MPTGQLLKGLQGVLHYNQPLSHFRRQSTCKAVSADLGGSIHNSIASACSEGGEGIFVAVEVLAFKGEEHLAALEGACVGCDRGALFEFCIYRYYLHMFIWYDGLPRRDYVPSRNDRRGSQQ